MHHVLSLPQLTPHVWIGGRGMQDEFELLQWVRDSERMRDQDSTEIWLNMGYMLFFICLFSKLSNSMFKERIGEPLFWDQEDDYLLLKASVYMNKDARQCLLCAFMIVTTKVGCCHNWFLMRKTEQRKTISFMTFHACKRNKHKGIPFYVGETIRSRYFQTSVFINSMFIISTICPLTESSYGN